MSQLIDVIRQFIGFFRVWVIVSPWEQCLRVRLGKHVDVLTAGVHLRIPIIDAIFLQSTRMRIVVTDRQTITTLDKKTASFAAGLGYEISDLEALYRSLHHAEDTLRNLVRSAIARDIASHDSTDLDPISVAQRVTDKLSLDEYGLRNATVFITDLLVARTYRIVGDYAAAYQHGTALSTEGKA